VLTRLFCLVWLATGDIYGSPTAIVNGKQPETIVIIERDDNANNAYKLDRVVEVEEQKSGALALLLLVDVARPDLECTVDVGGSELHPGEIGW
jgi:hypothetical protein